MPDALDEYLDPVLRLPVGGVEVTVPYPTIRVGLRCKRYYSDLIAGLTPPSIDPLGLLLNVHWDAATQTFTGAPDVSQPDLERCAWTALAFFGGGPQAADVVWRGASATIEPPAEPQLIDGPYGPYDPSAGAYGDDDPGGGPHNPATGIRDWYDEAPAPRDLTAALSWPRLLAEWPAVVCDFQQHYGIDLDTVIDSRTIAWLETRIAGLQHIPGSRIQHLTLTKE